MTKIKKTDLTTMYELLVQGATLQEIADVFGVSKQHIHNLRVKHFAHLPIDSYGMRKRKANERVKMLNYNEWKHNTKELYSRADVEQAMVRHFSKKKQNCKNTKWEFTITMEDVLWNTICPIFGTPIDWFTEGYSDNSPSIDRVDNTKGYVPGNVQIVSLKANRLKSNGTAEQHAQIAAYMQNHFKKYSE